MQKIFIEHYDRKMKISETNIDTMTDGRTNHIYFVFLEHLSQLNMDLNSLLPLCLSCNTRDEMKTSPICKESCNIVLHIFLFFLTII